MAKRTYSDQEKSDALVALDANGGNLTKAAGATGIPISTIQLWRDGHVHPAVTDFRNEKREPLADRLEALAHTIVDMLPEKLVTASAKDAAMSMGIALDKMQLLRGEPTNIHRDDNLPDEERADRAAALFDRARARRAGEADPAAVN